MMANRRVRAFMILLLAGFVPAVHASVALEMRSVGAQGIELAQGNATISLQLMAPGILHVHDLPHGHATPPDLVIDPHPAAPASFKSQVTKQGDTVTLHSDRMTVTWNGKTEQLRIIDAQGHPLLQEAGFAPLKQGRIVFEHATTDALYGIGGFEANQPVTAGLLRSGKWVAQAGKQGHAGAPFVWSTSGFGVLVDCGGANFDSSQGRITISDFNRPDADYYILVGTPRELFGALAKLSGPAPLFPKWAMGFTNSQWGIDEKELLDIVKTYRAKHIPIDNFTLDFDWKAWGQGDYGEFRWNPKTFSDGPSGKLAKMLDAEGMHVTGIMKPRIHVDTVEGRYATAHDLWIAGEKPFQDYFSHKQVKRLDFDKSETRRWFGHLAIEHGFDHGIAGWWNDEADEVGSDTQFLNMERALYDAQRAAGDERVWSINRNFWLGAQRYAYGLWSGDIDTGFASMAAQRTRMLSAIDVGEMKWGMDGGGFKGHPSDENYARWIEFGAFTPIFRVHGVFGEKRQPWHYGSVAEAAATRAIRLRYALLPYIYAYQHSDYAQGVGLVRPLTFGWPYDPAVRDDVDAWLFGQWLLVSPVVEQGQTMKHIYLPAGKWTDWFTGKTYLGGHAIDYPVNAKTWRDIPLFIRDGAIIPMQPVMDDVGQHSVTTVTVQVFPSSLATHFDYYDDDGGTYAYEKGAYFLQRLATRRDPHGVQFRISAPTGHYVPALRYYLVEIHGTAATSVSGIDRHYPDLKSLKAAAGEGWSEGHDRFGPVTWIRIPVESARMLLLH